MPVAVKRLHETYAELTVPRQKAAPETPLKQEPAAGSPSDQSQQEVPPDSRLEPEEEDFGAGETGKQLLFFFGAPPRFISSLFLL